MPSELSGLAPARGDDPELDAVSDELYRLDSTGDRVARVLRSTLDQLYDGQRTGRWNFHQLHKTEKTHMGTLVEINLHREFDFVDGDVTDYEIAGAEVDCKYSMAGSWSLPPEVVGHLVLVLAANDPSSQWMAGLVRVTSDRLNPGRNRDAKGTLSARGRAHIRWLWDGHPGLAPNLFHELHHEDRDAILEAKAPRGNQHGQARVDELFRRVQHRVIRRAELATVAQQEDFMKRARGNGGARTRLQPEGIVVLGHQDHDPLIAAALGLDVPQKGQFISARIVPAERPLPGPAAEIHGEGWRLAGPRDAIFAAPTIDRKAG